MTTQYMHATTILPNGHGQKIYIIQWTTIKITRTDRINDV